MLFGKQTRRKREERKMRKNESIIANFKYKGRRRKIAKVESKRYNNKKRRKKRSEREKKYSQQKQTTR